ncbi:MAG: hypothetical protein BRD45_01600, partial [Bacteroidetes bacterium QS_8_64_10]
MLSRSASGGSETVTVRPLQSNSGRPFGSAGVSEKASANELGSTYSENVMRISSGETLVAPAVPVGPSREHEAFAGTISLRQETLQRVVRDYLESLERQGYERAVVLPGHGG